MVARPSADSAAAAVVSAVSTFQANEDSAGSLRAAHGRHRHLDGQRVLGDREAALQLGVAGGDGEQHRARLVDRDAQVLDLVEGELEAGGEPRRRGAQHAEIAAVGGHGELHHVVVGRRLAGQLSHALIPPVRDSTRPGVRMRGRRHARWPREPPGPPRRAGTGTHSSSARPRSQA